MKPAFYIPFLALFSTTAYAGVWNTSNTWDESWEQKYSEWVQSDWDVDFFEKAGPLQGLKTDCADAVYSARVIFAAGNGLPFVMMDPTGGKKRITNEMSRFDKEVDGGKRLRSFLRYLYGVASTQSTPNDTYPVAVNRKSVKSGALILTDKKSHHTWLIKEVLPKGIPHLVFNSRPAQVKLKRRIGQPTTGFTFQGSLDPTRHAGFRAFRKPEDIGKPVFKVPGYSEEQYKIPLKTWMKTVQSKLALVQEAPDQQMKRLWDEVCQNAKERIQAVKDGFDFLSKLVPKVCLNATQYDDYSTPNRDQRLRESFELLDEMYLGLGADAQQVEERTLRDVEAALDVSKDSQSTCRIGYRDGVEIGLAEVYRRIKNGLISDNPHDPIQIRWGESKGPSERAKRCPKY